MTDGHYLCHPVNVVRAGRVTGDASEDQLN